MLFRARPEQGTQPEPDFRFLVREPVLYLVTYYYCSIPVQPIVLLSLMMLLLLSSTHGFRDENRPNFLGKGFRGHKFTTQFDVFYWIKTFQ